MLCSLCSSRPTLPDTTLCFVRSCSLTWSQSWGPSCASFSCASDWCSRSPGVWNQISLRASKLPTTPRSSSSSACPWTSDVSSFHLLSETTQDVIIWSPATNEERGDTEKMDYVTYDGTKINPPPALSGSALDKQPIPDQEPSPTHRTNDQALYNRIKLSRTSWRCWISLLLYKLLDLWDLQKVQIYFKTVSWHYIKSCLKNDRRVAYQAMWCDVSQVIQIFFFLLFCCICTANG